MSAIALSLIVTVCIIPIVIFVIWWYGILQEYFYIPFVLLGLPIGIGIIWVVFIYVRRKQARKEHEENQENVMNYEKNFEDFRQQLREYKTKRTKIEVLKICDTLVYDGDISNEICSISKTPFTQNDVALNCPYCMKKFKRKYLVEWLEKKDICPVCRVKIIVR
ncbi:MAG: hypothetical protein FK733_09365 [Asgard group archaeon]|nr:hypothetical protein [Asgard group archaeon]